MKIQFSPKLKIASGLTISRISAGADSCHLLTDGHRSLQPIALFGDRDPETIFLRPSFRESAARSRALMARF